ncbi:MAG: hypothetical protein DRN92_07335 [Thermoproteota archaeon]|nr:MAG: hypothetical protein DRN92_07335 [Candidatus Korarchaeota archaeon]
MRNNGRRQEHEERTDKRNEEDVPPHIPMANPLDTAVAIVFAVMSFLNPEKNFFPLIVKALLLKPIFEHNSQYARFIPMGMTNMNVPPKTQPFMT